MPSIRVALVEDEIPFAHAISTSLEHSPGFECIGTFPTIKEALKRIPKLLPEVVLVDLHLPDGDGKECIRQLREAAPTSLPLVLSKFDDPAQIFEAIRAGAFGYVLKTDGTRSLLDAIEAVAGGLAFMSPSIARRTLDELRKPAPKPATNSEESLTPRERGVLDQLRQGLDNKQIAEALRISPKTVAAHISQIYRKLHIKGRKDLLV